MVVAASTDSAGPQVVVITGSAQGIGRAFARSFADTGATVVIADRNIEKARLVAAECVSAGSDAVALDVDVTDPTSVEAMAKTTVERFGRIDVLVNNAAVFSTLAMKPFEEIDLAEWESVMRVNLTGTFLCCQAVAPQMRVQGAGRIVNLSSATTLFGRPFYLHYVASKAGVIGLTRGLAREMGAFGVTVNAVLPGSVETEIPRDSVTAEQAAAIVAGQSVHRRLQTADMVSAVLFLASPGAEAITGQSIVVDGGANFV
jgi:3-oxoacyl-[acyl-carrier protein] reductase